MQPAISDILCGRQLMLCRGGDGIALSAPPGFHGFDYASLESAMLSQRQAEWETEHEFCDGMYLRRTAIPAGVIVLGKRHRKPSLNLLLSGQVVLFAPNGMSTVLNAPKCFFGPSGSQKVAYTLTDIVCCSVFHVEQSTVDVVAAEIEVFE